MTQRNVSIVVLGVALLLLAYTQAQSPRKKLTPPKPPKAQCCEDVRSLKVQVANLTSILEELSRKQETDLMNVVRQIMELDQQNRQQEARVTEAESRYSEINNRVEIMQLQTLQSVTQTSSGEYEQLEKLYFYRNHIWSCLKHSKRSWGRFGCFNPHFIINSSIQTLEIGSVSTLC